MAERATQERQHITTILRIQSATDPEIQDYISMLKEKYQKFAVPIEEGKSVIDRAMGTRTLSEILYESRE